MLPSKPRYSAGARASSSATSGEPSRPRTSEVVSRIRFGPRIVNPTWRRRDVGIRQRRSSRDPIREPAVEDPDLLEAVGAEAPPRPRREQALGVVVDDHGGPIGDARPGRRCGHPVRAGEQDRPAVLARLDQVGPPVDLDRARDVSRREDASRAAIGTPPGIEDADLRPAEVFGQPLGGGQELGSGQATHRGYHRAVVVPFLPDAEKLTAIREAIPALSAGIYLNTGSVGPLPAETAAAMAELANRERDVGRAHVDDCPRDVARMAEARAGVAAVVGTDVDAVALTHSTTDGMNAATLLPDWRRGGRAVTTRLEHAGRHRAAVRPARPGGVELVLVDAGDDGDDARTIAAFDAAITARHAPRLRVARGLDDRGGPARRGYRRDRPRPRRAGRRRRRPGRRRHPVPLR